MKPESTQRLTVWRAEMAAELAEARKALPPLEAEHESAIGDEHNTRIAVLDLNRALGAVAHPAGPLLVRSRFHEAELTDARSRVARTLGAVAAARDRIAELERALAQIDQVLSSTDEETAG